MSSNADIALVTDSTADIPENLVDQFQIHVVPNIMVINGVSVEDGRGITREEFYRQLPTYKDLPTTATSSVGAYKALYQNLIEKGYKQIISIHAASTLSGIFNAARLAASEVSNRINVIDSEQITLGLGFQVLAAAQAIRNGASFQKVIDSIHQIRPRVRVFAMLDSLEYVRRSGRVSWARARIGSFLNIKPFVEVRDGKVLSIGEARTRRKGIERLAEILKKQGAIEKLAILHSNAEIDAYQFINEISNYINLTEQPLVVNITTIIGVYTGPNGLGFATVLST